MKKAMTQIYAYIIPLSKIRIERILERGKSVVVKFLSHKSLAGRFHNGTKILFYETGGQRMLLGEAIVDKAEMLLPSDVIPHYGDALFISSTELDAYVNRYPNRINKEILTLTLKNARYFKIPIQSSASISMVGRFLDKEMYDREMEKSEE